MAAQNEEVVLSQRFQFARYTERSRLVILLSQEEARSFGHDYIDTEHLLLGLIGEQEGIAALVLEQLGVGANRVRKEVVRIVGLGNDVPSGRLPYSERVETILDAALALSKEQRVNYLGTEHLLLALIAETESVAGEILRQLGAPIETIRARVLEKAVRLRRARVFLCHSSADKPAIRALYRDLRQDGLYPWFDEEDLLPGEDWDLAIRQAVRNVDCVAVCLSRASTTTAGYVHREIKEALDVADEQPEGTIFIIPVRLEECDVPSRLRHLHWVDLFADGGYQRLLRSFGPK